MRQSRKSKIMFIGLFSGLMLALSANPAKAGDVSIGIGFDLGHPFSYYDRHHHDHDRAAHYKHHDHDRHHYAHSSHYHKHWKHHDKHWKHRDKHHSRYVRHGDYRDSHHRYDSGNRHDGHDRYHR